jgi:hypothetical protein
MHFLTIVPHMNLNVFDLIVLIILDKKYKS